MMLASMAEVQPSFGKLKQIMFQNFSKIILFDFLRALASNPK
jgi:hypothetical protein